MLYTDCKDSMDTFLQAVLTDGENDPVCLYQNWIRNQDPYDPDLERGPDPDKMLMEWMCVENKL